ncbi:DUF3782 domain-containing protein [Candidatus Magnetomoraceae bacterium gMMP-15]
MPQNESRLDRIEKDLLILVQGISEMRDATRESQQKIDKQILQLKKSQQNTDKQILQLKKSQQKTDKQILQLKESQQKTDEQMKKTDEQMKKTDEQMKKTDKKLKEIGIQLGDLGLVQGEVAEDLFYRNVQYIFQKRDFNFNLVTRNLKKKGLGEYDIVADAGNAVLVIEVKNKLNTRMVDNFIQKRLPRFKSLFPKYKKSKLLGGIGALVVKDDVGRYAEKLGLYVLTQSNEGDGAAIFNSKNFKGKFF